MSRPIAHQVAAALQAQCDAMPRSGPHSVQWLDTRPMTSPHEHAPATVDWHQVLLAYATQQHLVAQHPAHAHLVRLTSTTPHCPRPL